MSTVSEAIRQHHAQLMETLRTHLEALSAPQPAGDAAALLRFLKTELLPHAQGEERHLYPALEPVLKTHGDATATMRVDHEYITAYIRQLEETVQALQQAAAQQATLQAQLQRLLWQLEGLLRVHLEKEERVYLPLFAQHLPEAEQQRVLAGMHAAYGEPEERAETVLDVRPLPPAQRHGLIFETFARLQPGEAFVLVNDHDPKPLYYQFLHEKAGQFSWEYVEQGPEVWRVRIGRTAAS
ncbi:MAG: hypothetical protein KatS3mg131_3601 [Candidatus Tectimicrobiota bacterium]|nr:MAG: hypothetical protein KatS3mg131_3601 [Candidatus Tectomicrobia bacterium]